LSQKTVQEYNAQLARCRELFVKKNTDYGTSWRILRISSLIDQIYIKAQRIRSIEEKQEQKVADSIESEYVGIINYCIIALIQIDMGENMGTEESEMKILDLYDLKAKEALRLMESKNHDYGEAWRQMYVSSFTDMILSKLLRMRQIIQNKGKTLVSEGIDAGLYDMINYAIFALIRLNDPTAPRIV
jgi:hypothetical protein